VNSGEVKKWRKGSRAVVQWHIGKVTNMEEDTCSDRAVLQWHIGKVTNMEEETCSEPWRCRF
jgi:hypothetical protein